ncbi:MAG: multicopper oxidase family protein [Proteobacteria bacterium]|nr:multicopper oxidase family protein [Pseudomonadota bacterium]
MRRYSGVSTAVAAIVFSVLAASAATAANGGAAPSAGATIHVTVGACGPTTRAMTMVEPQAVDMWEAPVDASGEHELILAVHTDASTGQFCYTYRWQGVVHTTAPAIHVRRGERFAIRIVNDIADQSPGEGVPSTDIPPCKPMQMSMPNSQVQHWVGYLNRVIDDRWFATKPVDTNLHMHGFEGPASEENVFLSTLSTPMHACEYRITIPIDQPPGTYMLHPHAHGAADAELGNGLAGVWIVDPDSPPLPRADEHVLLLKYQAGKPNDGPKPSRAEVVAYLTSAAKHEAALKPALAVRYDPFDPPPWPSAAPIRVGGIALDGCGGPFAEPLISVDGADAPAALPVAAGRTQLLRIVNGTSGSSKLLRLRDSEGHALPFELVERDGVPVSGDVQHPYARYLSMKEIMLSPMSRAAILLTAPAGAHFVLSSEPWCQGYLREAHRDLLRITAVAKVGDPPNAMRSLPIAASDTPAARLVTWVQAHPSMVHRRAITFAQYVFPQQGKVPLHIAYYITDTTRPDFHEHPIWPVYASGATVPLNPDIVVKQGTIEVWYLINTTLETHDFHIHQMKFVEESSYTGVPMTVDTVFQRVGKALPNPRDPDYPLIQPSITKVILDFRDVPKGTFVFHCHMLGHEDAGMMGTIRVE